MSHRKPPLPPSMRAKKQRGSCRWCALPIVNSKGEPVKKLWHRKCVKEFKLLHWPAETRRAVFERDQGKCARCARQHPTLRGNLWQHDHIRPLVEANGDLTFWHLDNIQTLCTTPCHVEKGKEDNARRRAYKLAAAPVTKAEQIALL